MAGYPVFALFAAIGAWTALLGGCQATVEEICADHLPAMIAGMEGARAPLAGRARDQARVPASLTVGMDEDEREDWQDWAESRLKRIQSFLDSARDRGGSIEVTARLNRTADNLVQFYGFAALGDRERMRTALEELRADADGVRAAMCKPGGG